MKKTLLIFGIIFLGLTTSVFSSGQNMTMNRGYDGSAFIFVEENVEFSVFPDGQFDFMYVGPQKSSGFTITTPNVNISFNSGYNYDAYVQYDDYGAVIQIENVPIYYDYYGRIIRAGNVNINYNNGRLARIGGLHIHYNPFGEFVYHTGFINRFNPYYIYRPWHVFYAPPIYHHVIVYNFPYRRYYKPIRYSYHQHIVFYKNRNNNAYINGRKDFHRPGSRIHYPDGRIVRNSNFNPNNASTLASTGRNNNTGNNTSQNIRNNNSGTNTSIIRNNSATTRSNVVTNEAARNNNVAPVRQTRNTTTTPIRTTTSVSNQNSSVRNNSRIVQPQTNRIATPAKRNTPAVNNNTRNVSNTSRNTTVQQNRSNTRVGTPNTNRTSSNSRATISTPRGRN